MHLNATKHLTNLKELNFQVFNICVSKWWMDSSCFFPRTHSWPKSLFTDVWKLLSVWQYLLILVSLVCWSRVWTLPSSILIKCFSPFVLMWLTSLRVFYFVQYCKGLWTYCRAEHTHLQECRLDCLIHCKCVCQSVMVIFYLRFLLVVICYVYGCNIPAWDSCVGGHSKHLSHTQWDLSVSSLSPAQSY